MIDKKYLTIAAIAIVCLAIGYFVRGFIDKPSPLPPIVETEFVDSGRPDSVWQRQVKDLDQAIFKLFEEKRILARENARLRNLKNTVLVDTVYKEKSDEGDYYTLGSGQFVSEKTFAWNLDMKPVDPKDNFIVKSHILSYSLLPVDSLDNNVVVRWNDYYKEKIEPQVQWEIEHSGNAGKLKGIAIGALAIAGLASQNEFLAVGGLAAAGGLYIFW